MKQQNSQLLFEAAMDKSHPEWRTEFSSAKIIMLSRIFHDGITCALKIAGKNLEILKNT